MMRRVSILLLVTCLAFVPGCGKKSSSKPTAPPNPNAALFGTWVGTLNSTDGVNVYQDGITLNLQNGSVVFTMSGATYPAAIVSMSDPNVTFTANIFGYAATFSGARSNNALNGTMSIPGLMSGNWAVSKTAPFTGPPAGALRLGDALGRR